MDIESLFGFLEEDYNLSYKYQEFSNCYGGNWLVQAHSFYNESGCFTFHLLVQRNELDFYCSPHFSTERDELCERMVDISTIEPEIWNKHMKAWIFKRPFFWWSNKKVLSAFSEALKAHLVKGNDLFGIRVNVQQDGKPGR